MFRASRTFVLGALLGVGTLLMACSSGGGSTATPAQSGGGSPATATAGVGTATTAAGGSATAAPGGATSTVDVTLNEWAVKADQSSVPAGKVDFKVKNGGTVAHELVVIKTDLAADKLPVKGSAVDTTQLDVAGTLAQFDAGGTKDLSLDLAPGHYVLICNLPGHYQLGMRTELTVK